MESGAPWVGRSHAELAELTRELLLAGHLIDRSGMPHLIARFGREGMAEVAIDEWMAASPIYSPRMRALLGFEGDTVEVIFKGIQLDIGAPPEFLDFRFTVLDDRHGSFHLDHCGALMDVEPMGDDYVRTMCHDIEDPTFDATAAAGNPRARIRPVHRPPRVPADRTPHCEWTVTIDPEVEPLPFPPQASALAHSAAARLPIASRPVGLSDDDGRSDYAGPLDPDLVLEVFSSATLAAMADEVCLQGHLLSRAFLLAVADRVGPEETAKIGVLQATGIAGLTSKRLAAVLDLDATLEGIQRLLEVHPLLLPRSYVGLEVVASGEGADASLVVTVGPGPALVEPDGLTWPALLIEVDDAPLRAAIQCLAPQARVERSATSEHGVHRWSVRIDPSAPRVEQPDAVTLAEFSTGASFHFERRSPRPSSAGR